MEPIRVSYTSPNDPYTYNILQGIAVEKKRLAAVDRPVRPFLQIMKGIAIRGAIAVLMLVVLILLRIRSGELWHLYYLLPITTAILTFVLYFVVGAVGQYKQNLKLNRSIVQEGELLFDEEGLTDYLGDGQITRRLWDQFDMCIVTDVLVVFFFGSMMIYVRNSEETARAICEAMEKLGKSDRVYRRRIKGALNFNKIS